MACGRRRIEAALLLAALAASVTWRATCLPSHDASWFATIAAALLDGIAFYERFLDPNWPLAAYAMVPAGALWRAGLSMGAALSVETHALAALSLGLCLAVLRRTSLADGPRMDALLALTAAELVLPGADFGQREHLFLLLALPHLLLAWTRVEGRDPGAGLAAFIGVAAGIGAAIKPPFMLVPLAVEAVVALRTRRLVRPETLAALAVMAAASVLVLAAFPQYLEISRRVLSLYGANHAAEDEWVMVSISLLAAGGAMIGLWAGGWRRLAPAMAAVLAAILFYWLQGKGWAYQGLPAYGLAAALSGLAWASAATRLRRMAAAAMAAILALLWAMERPPPPAGALDPFVAMLRAHPGSFYALSVLVTPSFPAAPLARKDWAGRTNSLFLLPGIAQAERRAAARGEPLAEDVAAARDWLRHSVAQDLERGQPALVLVPPALTSHLGEGFDLLAWFATEPAFRTAWAAYAHTGDFQGIALYERISPPSSAK